MAGMNVVGLKRRGFSRNQIRELRAAYRLLFAQEGTFAERLDDAEGLYGDYDLVQEIVAFIRKESHLIALDPFVPKDKFPESDRLRLGQFGKMLRRLKSENCTHVCFAGIVKRPDFKRLKPDLKAMRHLAGTIRAAGQGDDALMRHVLGLFEQEGFQCKIAAAIGGLDIGQGAVIARGVTLAVEAQEGTDAMLKRLLELPEELRGTSESRTGVFAKLIKPDQDIRIDLPTLGPETVRHAARAGLAGIVAEAGGAFIIDREETVRIADKEGLFIAGLPKTE